MHSEGYSALFVHAVYVHLVCGGRGLHWTRSIIIIYKNIIEHTNEGVQVVYR